MNHWLAKKNNNTKYSNYFYSLYDYNDIENIIYYEDEEPDLEQDEYYNICDTTKENRIVKFISNTNQTTCNFIYKLIMLSQFDYDIPVITNIGYYKSMRITIDKNEFYKFLSKFSN